MGRQTHQGIKMVLHSHCSVHSAICETWTISESNVKKLEVFQMRCLRRLCGFSLLDRIPNTGIRAECQVPMIAVSLRYRRLRWLGHAARMDNVRLPLQMMFSTMTGSGARGRSLKAGMNTWEKILLLLGMHMTGGKNARIGKFQWKTIIQVLLDVPSP